MSKTTRRPEPALRGRSVKQGEKEAHRSIQGPCQSTSLETLSTASILAPQKHS